MAARITARYISQRFSSGGKILSEEEKAAENVYIKKMEKEKLEKLARKGPKPGDEATSSSVGTAADAKTGASATTGASTENVSSDTYRNYAVVAGLATALGAFGWYFMSGKEKKQEVRD